MKLDWEAKIERILEICMHAEHEPRMAITISHTYVSCLHIKMKIVHRTYTLGRKLIFSLSKWPICNIFCLSFVPHTLGILQKLIFTITHKDSNGFVCKWTENIFVYAQWTWIKELTYITVIIILIALGISVLSCNRQSNLHLEMGDVHLKSHELLCRRENYFFIVFCKLSSLLFYRFHFIFIPFFSSVSFWVELTNRMHIMWRVREGMVTFY